MPLVRAGGAGRYYSNILVRSEHRTHAIKYATQECDTDMPCSMPSRPHVTAILSAAASTGPSKAGLCETRIKGTHRSHRQNEDQRQTGSAWVQYKRMKHQCRPTLSVRLDAAHKNPHRSCEYAPRPYGRSPDKLFPHAHAQPSDTAWYPLQCYLS